MIKVFEPYITFNDKINVLRSINSKNISGSSNTVNEFENNLKAFFKRKFAVALSNGSTALDVSFQIANLKKGDEVVVPSFTIISCLSAIIRTGAKPVFCDINLYTWNMELENVKKVVTSKTKAVLMVHIYGLTAEALQIENYCKENNIFLIEDAAEAHGQIHLNRKCGSFGNISTLSFYANKHITTGEGGALLTDSKEVYLKALQMRNLDFKNKDRFKHENLYWNYRMGGLQAALGISQLKSVEKVIQNKAKQAAIYMKLFEPVKDKLQLPLLETKQSKNHFWVFGIVNKTKLTRDFITTELFKQGIETRPFFWPLHLQRINNFNFEYNILDLKNSEFIGSNGFYIPIGPHLKFKHQKYIVQSISKILN